MDEMLISNSCQQKNKIKINIVNWCYYEKNVEVTSSPTDQGHSLLYVTSKLNVPSREIIINDFYFILQGIVTLYTFSL